MLKHNYNKKSINANKIFKCKESSNGQWYLSFWIKHKMVSRCSPYCHYTWIESLLKAKKRLWKYFQPSGKWLLNLNDRRSSDDLNDLNTIAIRTTTRNI